MDVTGGDNFSMSIGKERASEESSVISTINVGVIGEEGLHHDEESTSSSSVSKLPDFTKAFNDMFFSTVPKDKSPLDILKNDAFNGLLAASPLRGLAWRIFLGCLETDKMNTWETTISEQRQLYQHLVTTHYVNPRDQQQQQVVFDPLSNDENSPWNKFFRNQERQKTITLDIERTYQDFEFFQDQQTKDIMLRILFIYSTSTPDISYRQGMHELLAPMLYLITHEVEKYKKSELEKIEVDPQVLHASWVNIIYDPNYIEHDVYILFSKLMKTSVHWFGATGGAGNTSPTNTPVMKHHSLSDDPNKEPQQHNETIVVNQAVIKCKTINNLLRAKDVELYNHLESLDIEPQLYLLRWIRLLFGREFHLEDVLSMWDAIFAYGDNLHLIDFISISMLSFIRDQLIGKDNSSVLKRLFKYPPVEDIQYLIRKAFSIKDTPGPINNSITTFGQITSLPTTPSYISSTTFTPITSVLNNNPTFNPTNPNKSNYRKTMSHLSAPSRDDISSSTTSSSSSAFSGSSNNPLSNSATFTPPPPAQPRKPASIFSLTPTDDILGLGGLSIGISKTSTKSSSSSSFVSSSSSSSTNATSTFTSSSNTSTSTSTTTNTFTNTSPLILGTPPNQSSAISTPSFTSSTPSSLVSSDGNMTVVATSAAPLTTTSVNLNTARSNYFNPVASPKDLLPKQSYVSKKANPKTNPAKRLRNAQRYLGNQLGNVIPILQTNIVENTSLANHDELVLAVANIKQIKDMLLGDLPIVWDDIPDNEFDDEDDTTNIGIEDPLSK
ncbi:TBC1 domain family member 5 like protein [Cavenderia fasciculata]|uniref:TBC1 domain family member 5 like protein n=1 Tax=Cavenderia fasciculata TaxID=261658 RepID=F4QDV0_CACFS|nr:TBC1 domain family member 5 like protein [Cavenderia fasciculata]EGG13897.1 TBC1 domain family member 5 like protein [Cavenderia fasciculata]|eukprot:XP_004350605.1 TBC1 domain family member 5 like protein [Cavenderia fasciculata]